MVKEAGSKLEKIKDLLNEPRQLDLHYIPSRYPNGIPSGFPHGFYSAEISEQALKSANQIFTAVLHFFQSVGEVEIYQIEGK